MTKKTVVTSQLYVVNITISNIMSLLTGESFSLPIIRREPRTGWNFYFFFFYISADSSNETQDVQKKVKYFIFNTHSIPIIKLINLVNCPNKWISLST